MRCKRVSYRKNIFYLRTPKKSSTFAAILERCSIMETKEQQVRESQAWRAARETQGTIIIHDPKYM